MVYGLRSAIFGRKGAHDRPSTYSVLAVFLIASLSGCSHIEPWVKPYERSAFADPIMAADRNPASGA